jgi:hypothetical protein
VEVEGEMKAIGESDTSSLHTPQLPTPTLRFGRSEVVAAGLSLIHLDGLQPLEASETTWSLG